MAWNHAFIHALALVQYTFIILFFFLLQNNNPSNKLMYVNTILQLINVQTTKT